MEISECFLNSINESVLEVHNKKVLEIVRNKICNYWGQSTKGLFPGVQPVSLERKDIPKLGLPYVVCAKLDGERFFFFSTNIDSNRLHFIVNRNFNIYIVNQNIKEGADEGSDEGADEGSDTLLDGEVLDNQFVIHDCIVVNGKNVMRLNWEMRYHECDKFLNKYNYSEKFSFRICMKKFFHLNQITQLFVEMEKDNVKNDGIVMYPINEPVGYRTQYTLFKWKYKHTIDFQIIRNGKMYDLYCTDRLKKVKFGSVTEDKMVFLQPLVDNQIVEFIVESENTFIPMKIRNDKSTGNSLFTTNKTILNKMENITKQEICALFNNTTDTPTGNIDDDYVKLEY